MMNSVRQISRTSSNQLLTVSHLLVSSERYLIPELETLCLRNLTPRDLITTNIDKQSDKISQHDA